MLFYLRGNGCFVGMPDGLLNRLAGLCFCSGAHLLCCACLHLRGNLIPGGCFHGGAELCVKNASACCEICLMSGVENNDAAGRNRSNVQPHSKSQREMS